MPGNEVGDKVHNFFDQSSLSQDQPDTQFVEANWPGFHNNVWDANERHIGGLLNTSSRNYTGQQSEIERGQNNQFSLASHGLKFTQSNVKSEFVKSPPQAPQVNLNGVMHTPQVGNIRQNETNFLGVGRGSDRHNMTSRGLSILDSQQRSLPQHRNFASFVGSQVPMNFDFLGSQQQMSGHQSGMFQSIPMQQSGINDAQLMQQQAMFKQMQELQRRQQLQQFEAMQRNAMDHMSSVPNQPAGQHSQAINGNPVQNTSNFPWQSQVMAGGTNWQQPGHPSAVNAYSNGFMVHPEQGQAMHFMGLTPQQASQSLYGVPVSNSAGANPFSNIDRDKPGLFHMPTSNSPFSGSPYAPHREQAAMQDVNAASRFGSEGKTSIEHGSRQGSENAVDLGGFNQVQQRTLSMSDDGRHGQVDRLDIAPEKSLLPGATSETTSSQGVVGLDPTEEKILFGNGDNIWEAFGGESVTGNDGADLFNGFPSMQSGTWSALMQSAVAETSSGDGGTQEEWSGLESHNSRSQSRNQHLTTSQGNEKASPVWFDSSQRASLGSSTLGDDVNSNNAILNTSYSHKPFTNLGSSPRESQALQERRWLDSNSPQPHTEGKRVVENSNYSRDLPKTDSSFWSQQQDTYPPKSVRDSNINSMVESGGFGLRNININHESSERPNDNLSLDHWKQASFADKSGIVSSGNALHNMNKGQSPANSSVNIPGGRVAETRGVENGDGRETSSDSHQSRFRNHALSGYSKENVWPDAGRVPVARKFQYHPMGDVDIDESSSAKEVLYSKSMSPSSGFKTRAAQSPLLSPAASSLSDKEKGQGSGFHKGVVMVHGGLSSAHPGYLPSMSAPFARSGENSATDQNLPHSQDMLELLDKVDQSTDCQPRYNQNSVSNLGSSSTHYNNSSDIPSGGRGGPDLSQSSSSHSFGLQLAPPSQGITFSNLNDPSQSSLRSVGSPSTQFVSSEKGDNLHARSASGSSGQCLPHSYGSPHLDSGYGKPGCSDGLLSNMKGSLSASLASNPTYLRNPFQNQHMTAPGGQMMNDHQSSIVSSDRFVYHDQQSTITQNQSGISASMQGGSYSRTPQQKNLGVQAHNNFDFMKSHSQSNDPLDMNSQQKKDVVDGPRSTDVVSSPIVADSPKNIDAFHHSSRPNSVSRQSYSLLQQMQAMKTMDMDPSHQESKRFRGPEHGPNFPDKAVKEADPSTGDDMISMGRDPSASQTSVSSGYTKMLGVSPQPGNKNISQLPHGTVASQDTLSFGRSDPQTFLTGNVGGRAQLPVMSPQMVPSRFNQYGTLKNEPFLPVHDNVPIFPMVKNVEQQFIMTPSNGVVQNSSQIENAVIDTCQIAKTSPITNAKSDSEHLSLHVLVPHDSSPSPVPLGPKKRKTATSELIPWNKEISQGFKRVQNISSAEVDWAQSSNRLVERGGDEIDSYEDMSPMIRSRKRLIMTTKLMQQVIYPPSASILSLDGRSNYKVIMYSISRQALGDACNLVCRMESETPPDKGNHLSGKAKTSDTTCDQYISKVMEDFTNRAKELNNNLLRLDKSTSILDFRLECQDLERFSVINRFARFHGRSQADGVETSSSSDSNAASQKPLPQRYVTAHPMPRTVPERVQCLTLN